MKPKAKEKRGIVVRVERAAGGAGYFECAKASYSTLRRAGLPELKPGESVKVRVVIEPE